MHSLSGQTMEEKTVGAGRTGRHLQPSPLETGRGCRCRVDSIHPPQTENVNGTQPSIPEPETPASTLPRTQRGELGMAVTSWKSIPGSVPPSSVTRWRAPARDGRQS